MPQPQAEPGPPAVSQIKPAVTQRMREAHTAGDDSVLTLPHSKKNAKEHLLRTLDKMCSAEKKTSPPVQPCLVNKMQEAETSELHFLEATAQKPPSRRPALTPEWQVRPTPSPTIACPANHIRYRTVSSICFPNFPLNCDSPREGAVFLNPFPQDPRPA